MNTQDLIVNETQQDDNLQPSKAIANLYTMDTLVDGSSGILFEPRWLEKVDSFVNSVTRADCSEESMIMIRHDIDRLLTFIPQNSPIKEIDAFIDPTKETYTLESVLLINEFDAIVAFRIKSLKRMVELIENKFMPPHKTSYFVSTNAHALCARINEKRKLAKHMKVALAQIKFNIDHYGLRKAENDGGEKEV